MLGWPGQIELREKVKRGELLGPTLHLAGPSFSGASIQSAAQAEARVREQKAQGWDLLKVHPGLKRDHYDAMARSAKEVGIRFAGHIPADVGLVHAIEQGQETVDHLDGYIEYLGATDRPVDPAKLTAVVKLTRESGTWVIPTMCLWETILGAADLEKMSNYPELKYMPPDQVEQWKKSYQALLNRNDNRKPAQQTAANRKVLLKALSDGGVKILFGTDAPQQFSVPGFSIHREIRAMAEAGMRPHEILKSATANVGEYFKDKDRFGVIAPGTRADLLLLEANPLEDASNVARRSGVMVRGRWLTEGEIQTRLEKIAGLQENGKSK
jgi:imidazolonepropionase-like amidohydrolase